MMGEFDKQLTPRQQYALAAMQGMLASCDSSPGLNETTVAENKDQWYRNVRTHAYHLADLMLEGPEDSDG